MENSDQRFLAKSTKPLDEFERRELIVVVSKPRSGSSLMMDILSIPQVCGFHLGPAFDSPISLGIRRGRKEILHEIFQVGWAKPNEEVIRLIHDCGIEAIKLVRGIERWLEYFEKWFNLKLIILTRDEIKRKLSAVYVQNIDSVLQCDEEDDNQLPKNNLIRKYKEKLCFVPFEKIFKKDVSTVKRLLEFVGKYSKEREDFIIKYMIEPENVQFSPD